MMGSIQNLGSETLLSIKGVSEDGNKFLTSCFTSFLEALKTGTTPSLEGIFAHQEVRSHPWENYQVTVRDKALALPSLDDDYHKKLMLKFPLHNDQSPHLCYDPEKIKSFGEELKGVIISKFENYRHAQSKEMDKILEERLAKNSAAKVVTKIICGFDEYLKASLKDKVFWKDEDVSKLYEELMDRSLKRFHERAKEQVHVTLLTEAFSHVTLELMRRRPNPEDVWRSRCEGMIEAAKTKHRELLESVEGEEALNIIHARFYEVTTIDGNPFPEGSEWHKKLEEKVKEELDKVFKEIKSRKRAEEPQAQIKPKKVSGAWRRSNLILYGLTDARVEDQEHLYKYISEVFEVATNKKVGFKYAERLGEFREGAERPRPVRIVFHNESDKNLVFKHRKSEYFLGQGLALARDMSSEERCDLRVFCQEVERIQNDSPGMIVTANKERKVIVCRDGRRIKVEGGKVLQLSNISSSTAEGTNPFRPKRPLSPSPWEPEEGGWKKMSF